MEYVLDYVNISDWKTKKEIIKELFLNNFQIDERTWRRIVKEHNQKFFNHEVDDFIAHSSKGYKRTSNTEEILLSINDNRKRALDMLYEESKVRKAIGENCNLSLYITNDEFQVIENWD